MRHNIAKYVAVVASVIALGLCLSGCSKQRSELAQRKAGENIKTARERRAEKYDDSKPILSAAEKALKDSTGASQSKDHKGALTNAQEAVKQSKEALKTATRRYADERRQEAGKAVQVATVNDGRNENEQLFTDAEKKLNQANEKFNKSKYENTIELSDAVIENVNKLLTRLQNASESRLRDLEQKKKELERANAQKHNPNALVRATESIDQITSEIAENRNYKQAIILAGTAINEADVGLVETKRRDATQRLQTLEAKIAEAIAEEAQVHTPEALRGVEESFDQLLTNFYENQYDSVLLAAEDLEDRVNKLIIMARIESTKARIAEVIEDIQRLKQQNVEQYLPGRIKVMEDLLAESQNLFNNNDYDGAKFQASNAKVERDRIEASFDAMTEKTIQDATAALQTAQRTYDRMKSIFTAPQSRVVDNRLEAQRQVDAANLEARLEESKNGIDFANTNLSAKEYKKAIEQAKDANATADAVTNGTYRVVAQHTLVGIQDETSQLERQGARTSASRQLNQVQTLVEQTQKLISENHNREAVEVAAKARAYLENVKQELARQATNERNTADQMMRRLEGGAAPTPASGGGMRPLQRSMEFGEFPGGASLNNKEAMFEADAAQLLKDEPIVVAQVAVSQQHINSTGSGYGGAVIENRNVPAGTFMTDSKPNLPYGIAPEPGAKTGAIIGTRPEPVVSTRESAGMDPSRGSYEAPTSPGPFMAATSPAGVSGETLTPVTEPQIIEPGSSPTTVDTGLEGIRQQVESILMDDERILDIQRFQPRAIERARERLEESSQALAAGNYMRAVDLARDAQRIVLEAEQKAAKAATEENLQSAADRINLAEAAGSISFAPAQLMESISLYKQATNQFRRGDYIASRATSAQAIIAADDARLYNVNKARDLTALSTRYGGWRSSHPLMVQGEQGAAIAEDMLGNPATAAQGQQVAQQAVQAAQLALDHARDYTFQERIDNIYKALNTALRAGANYFNVNEVQRLIAELAVARDEYCTRNFDAVEMKLKDIEARLARVIETTPLVLEQNLIETTEKLNALVLAGAENWNAQEVDDVKSLMNRSAVDFRKHDYQSSYVNLRNAQRLTDEIELRLQEQVYFDAVTELFAQMDMAFHDFEKVINYDRAFMKRLIATQFGQPRNVEFTGRMSPNDFRDKITDIYLRAIHLKPPKSQEGTHNQVLLAIKFAKVASENFQKLLILDQVSMPDAYDIIDTAYNQIERSRHLRGEVQVQLIEPQARTRVIRAERIVNF